MNCKLTGDVKITIVLVPGRNLYHEAEASGAWCFKSANYLFILLRICMLLVQSTDLYQRNFSSNVSQMILV